MQTIKVRTATLKNGAISSAIGRLVNDAFSLSVFHSFTPKKRTNKKIIGTLFVSSMIEDNEGEFQDERLWYNAVISRNQKEGYRFVI
jgi:hypothetical protein